MENMFIKNKIILFVSLLILVADQLTKISVAHYMELNSVLEIFPIFNLVYIENTGISFGLFSNNSAFGPYIIALLSCCIIGVIGMMAFKAKSKFQKFSFALIIGGALGNVIDRVTDKAVTDFLDFFIGVHHWPAFNLADIAIVCGAGLVLIDSLRRSNEEGQNNA